MEKTEVDSTLKLQFSPRPGWSGRICVSHNRSNSKRCRQLRLLAVVAVALTVFFGPAHASARRRKKRGGKPPAMSARVLQIAQQLPGATLDDAQPTARKIEHLVLADLDQWSASRTVSFVEVRSHLEQDFSLLTDPLSGSAASFEQPWHGETLIVAGYTLGWSNYDRVNVIAIYRTGKGSTRRIATINFVPRTDLRFIPLVGSSFGSLRFIAYGWRLGMSEPRLTAALYSFDGKSLRRLWERRDAFAGKISVLGEKVMIRYVDEQQFINSTSAGDAPQAHEAIYQLTRAGLKLLSIQPVRFP